MRRIGTKKVLFYQETRSGQVPYPALPALPVRWYILCLAPTVFGVIHQLLPCTGLLRLLPAAAAAAAAAGRHFLSPDAHTVLKEKRMNCVMQQAKGNGESRLYQCM
ncbi:hypothetical protein LY76DRAFT_169907 [Colletotrichum caudatum]|nr:hypothetical protein LY76DRAFT_169907 [Colletotrichum caudatum]